MIHAIAVDGPPISHCYEAMVVVSLDEGAGSRIGEISDGEFREIPAGEFEFLLRDQRVFSVAPPLTIPPGPGESPLALVASAKLLRLTETSGAGWAHLEVPGTIVEDPGISAVEPRDREWKAMVAPVEEVRRIRAEWFESLKSIARDGIRQYQTTGASTSLDRAIEAAELASEAAWMDDRSVKVANEYLGLAYSFHEPEKTQRLHEFLTYRFPEWRWDDFSASRQQAPRHFSAREPAPTADLPCAGAEPHPWGAAFCKPPAGLVQTASGVTRTVTFWSYKGGVGRTMALVNTAYQLAAAGKRVVIWEMDLEAPGLLQIPLFSKLSGAVRGGVIDIMHLAEDRFDSIPAGIAEHMAEFQDTSPSGAEVRFHILAAGALGAKYHEKYVSLDWGTFFDDGFGHGVFEEIQRAITEQLHPDFILVDSRTGITDLSAICCFQLPDTLVIVSTLAYQGLAGVAEVKRTVEQRNSDLRRPERQIETLAIVSHLPQGDRDRVNERLRAFEAAGVKPDYRIELEETLLLEETIVSRDRPWHANAGEFGRLARRLLGVEMQPISRPADDPNLEWLSADTRWIELRGLRTVHAAKFDISRMYIPLTATSGEGESVPLEAALSASRAVIIGEPGSGKTTFLRWLAQQLLRGTIQPAGYPILIRVADLDNHIEHCSAREDSPSTADAPDWLEHYLAANARRAPGPLGRPDMVLLLDGLDEASSDAGRERLVRLVQHAASAYPDSRIVVTTRPGARTPNGFERFTINPLDDRAIEAYLRVWFDMLLAGDPEEAGKNRAIAMDALSRSAEIRNLARNPVMLTAIGMEQWNKKRLPEQRAELFEAIIEWFLRANNGARSNDARRSLGALALRMQSAATRVTEASPNDRLEALQAPGIIRRNGPQVEFTHLAFQEYLAARQLAGLPNSELHQQINSMGWPVMPHMRETLLLLAAILGQRGSGAVRDLFDSLVGNAGDSLADRASRVALVRAMRHDLAAYGVDIPHDGYLGMVRETVALFELGAAPGLSPSVRIEAAEALGEMGDPRLRVPSEDGYWVRIPAGLARLGAHREIGSPGYDPEARDGETSRVLAIREMSIGRFPVTVHEYAKFVEHGGSPPHHWDEQLRHPSRPVVWVTAMDATAYCQWAAVRLPTDDEWEFAARGIEGRRFPWGEELPDERRANFNAGLGCSPVGLFPDGGTPEGVMDLAGNVREWIEGGGVRGGSWRSVSSSELRCARPSEVVAGGSYDDVGFRCVREEI